MNVRITGLVIDDGQHFIAIKLWQTEHGRANTRRSSYTWTLI